MISISFVFLYVLWAVCGLASVALVAVAAYSIFREIYRWIASDEPTEPSQCEKEIRE